MISDILFIIPLILGLGVIAVVAKVQVPKGQAMNRPVFGFALVLGAVL